jgi:hypothetical protein
VMFVRKETWRTHDLKGTISKVHCDLSRFQSQSIVPIMVLSPTNIKQEAQTKPMSRVRHAKPKSRSPIHNKETKNCRPLDRNHQASLPCPSSPQHLQIT